MEQSKRLGVARALVDGAWVEGDVEVTGEVVTGVGLPGSGTRMAVPGFIDVQVNGFAGVDFSDVDVPAIERAARAMAATGVTAYQPTFITLPEATVVEALSVYAEHAASVEAPAARVLGVHLEGPFLSPHRHGAHDERNLRAPDTAMVERFLAAGPVAHMTLAPELDGALEVIRLLADRGVVAAIGHSNATAEEATAGEEAGATSVTHLYNAQRPWSHRDPGITGAALASDRLHLSIIPDGIHLAPEAVHIAHRCAPGRLVVITDAIAAAGEPDGEHLLGGLTVTLADGACRLEDGTLAGSVLRMDEGLRNLVSYGIDLLDALDAVAGAPSRLVGRPELGTLAPGTPADLVVLDDALEVQRTMCAGRETFAA